MKRKGNLYEQTFSIQNLMLADKRARKGKSGQDGIMLHDRRRGCNIITLHNMLMDKTFSTSQYKNFTLFDPKERQISALPFYPDRIVHHTAMIPLERIFVSTFTADTYSCIKGRGIHAASNALKKALKDTAGTQYCLKLDIRKFYPSVDHGILKQLIRRKLKDIDFLWLLDDIINSAPGVPIGNYLSQYFANFYLAYFDHWLKETKRVKYYFRYADDLVLLSGDKAELHSLLAEITHYLKDKLNLTVKDNYQVFPVCARGIDFVGYVHFHTHTLLRKSIKKNFARMLVRRKNNASITSYKGWLMHANTKNLIHKLLKPHEHIPRTGGKIKEPDRRQN